MGNAATLDDLKRESSKLTSVNQKLAENENELKRQANQLAQVQIDHENFLSRLTADEKKLQEVADENQRRHALEAKKHLERLGTIGTMAPEDQLEAFKASLAKRKTASDYMVYN